jgi:membrane dipeptidase
MMVIKNDIFNPLMLYIWDGAYEMHFAVTGLPLIVTALEKEGFSKQDIEKIMGGNIRDFFLRNLPD